MENSETQVWIDFVFQCKYINEQIQKDLLKKSTEVGRLLNDMIKYPEKYFRKNIKVGI
ncbi:MAG: four helix bundle protein [Nitrospinota bacterium]